MTLKLVDAVLSDTLSRAVEDAEALEGELAAAHAEIESLNERLAQANNRIASLEMALCEAEQDDEVFDWIADVRRGLLSLDELYERALG
jgi:predicted  nucleic acid-binding Zn-ribbon protein